MREYLELELDVSWSTGVCSRALTAFCNPCLVRVELLSDTSSYFVLADQFVLAQYQAVGYICQSCEISMQSVAGSYDSD